MPMETQPLGHRELPAIQWEGLRIAPISHIPPHIPSPQGPGLGDPSCGSRACALQQPPTCHGLLTLTCVQNL